MTKMILALGAVVLMILGFTAVALAMASMGYIDSFNSPLSWQGEIHRAGMRELAAQTGFPKNILEHESDVLIREYDLSPAEAAEGLKTLANTVHAEKGTVEMLDQRVAQFGQARLASSGTSSNGGIIQFTPEAPSPAPAPVEAKPSPFEPQPEDH
jgi:hypothetical protein